MENHPIKLPVNKAIRPSLYKTRAFIVEIKELLLPVRKVLQSLLRHGLPFRKAFFC
jgi:hypothetical protein